MNFQNGSIRVIETSISRENIVAQVSAFLYSVGLINDNEDILDITFEGLTSDVVPMKIQIQKNKEVKVINHVDG